jgi:hypothetical protein
VTLARAAARAVSRLVASSDAAAVHFTPPISRGRLRVGPDGKVLPGELALCGHLVPEAEHQTREIAAITCLACSHAVAQHRAAWERASARLVALAHEPR